jgi:hypothetical protein
MCRMTGGCAASWSTVVPWRCPGAVHGWALWRTAGPHQGVRGERLRGADRASSGLFRDGRGVAHLVLPDEVQVQPSTAPAQRPDGRFSDRRIRPDDAALSQAAALVRDARRPVIIVGHGARGAASEVRLLAERLNARC